MKEDSVALRSQEAAVVVTREDVKKYYCPTASDKEIFMFIGMCRSLGLDPMKREVHLIKYANSPATIVTGYGVYLKRAERTGKMDGWSVDVSNDAKSATVTIHRKDWSKPFIWTAYRQEFDKGQANWKSMPLFMLRKVAIAQAFRLCFPDEMGGMPYLPEEIIGGNSESLPSQAIETTATNAGTAGDMAEGAGEPPPANLEENILGSFDQAQTMDELSKAWTAIPVGSRRLYSSYKDMAKARISGKAA